MATPEENGQHAEPAPPWSDPTTQVNTPPLGGAPAAELPPASPAPGATPEPLEQAAHDVPPGTPTATGPAGWMAPARDRRIWFLLGLVALLLSVCCTAGSLIALAWAAGLFDR